MARIRGAALIIAVLLVTATVPGFAVGAIPDTRVTITDASVSPTNPTAKPGTVAVTRRTAMMRAAPRIRAIEWSQLMAGRGLVLPVHSDSDVLGLYSTAERLR